MVQDQLVEYVSSQLKLGISRDAVKTALVGVGWAPLDVEDTLKKVEGTTTAAPAQPAAPQKTPDVSMGAAASPKFVSFSAPGTVAGQVKNPEPQAVRVSDLVSSVAPASTGMPVGSAPKIMSSGMAGNVKATPIIAVKDQFPKAAPMGTSAVFAAPLGQKKKVIGLVDILALVLIVIIGAFAAYLFIQNNGLNSELQAAQTGTQNAGTAQSAATQAELQALDASDTALVAQVVSLGASAQALATNLSFLVVPAGSSATSTPVSVSGTLAAGLGKNTYSIATPYGVKVSVKNSSDNYVAAALQPLLGSSVQVSGTYIPGTPNITVTSVNGSPVSPPPAMATTTPTSTKTSTATTTP